MTAFGELFDHFSVERWDIVGFAAGTQSTINDDFLIDPACARIAHIDLYRRPGSHSSSANKVRADQNLWPMANDRDRLALPKEVPCDEQRSIVGAHCIRIVQAAGDH